MAQAKDIGAPHKFLYKRFPNWKQDRQTYMIPPVFTPKAVEIAIEGLVHYHDSGELGESIIFNRLKELGEKMRSGMFVVHGFHLKDVLKWNKKCAPDYKVPSIRSEDVRECDFIIFHHALGIISIEVKNVQHIRNNNILSAERQLKTSHDLVEAFAAFNLKGSKSSPPFLPHWKVIAMPSTKKLAFDRKAYPNLEQDTILLFEDDSEDIESFEEWWRETFDTAMMDKMAPEVELAYEHALSYTLMVRHLGPLSESDYIADLSLSLDSFRHLEQAAYSQVLESEFPHFWRWCSDVLDKIDKAFDFGVEEAFMKSHQLNNKGLNIKTKIKILNELLEYSEYIFGDVPSVLDAALAVTFEDKYLLFFKNIVRFFNAMRQMRTQVKQWKVTEESPKLDRFAFSKLTTVKDFNKLDRHLSRFTFMEGEEPTKLDKDVFETLTCKLRVKYSHLPIVLTTEQLAVFEGPEKQVIIGAPGSGKTELMKFKALELDNKMKACEAKMKILYIVATGSPSGDPLLSYQIKDFFKKSTLVEVMTIVIEEESPQLLEHTKTVLQEKMASGEYGHVFIDEYWIGAKPAEHWIILELVTKIPGYVWISSVFDYRQDMLDTSKMSARTKPLLVVLKEQGGQVSRISQVVRATNNIINLERHYSALYRNRSYPYGPEQILGHSLEGLPTMWVIANSIDSMYNKCTQEVDSAIKEPAVHSVITKERNLTLNPADILIVNFAVRAHESLSVGPSLEARLNSAKIPIWSFGESLEQFMNCDEGKVTLLNSHTREESTHLDGVEWPMVVVILPSGVLLNEVELAEGAERLRNYDTYISFFRTQVKLVVISDKWTNETEFLEDIERKFK